MAEPSETVKDLQEDTLEVEQAESYAGKFKPNKRQRHIRRTVYERYYELRDAPSRLIAEKEWEIADKEYRMYISEEVLENRDGPDGWKAVLTLPDAFAAIQTQMQETIDRKSRPALIKTEQSDEPLEDFGNAVLTYNMNNTKFDYEWYRAKLAAAIRGTSFLWEHWRLDKRIVKDPTDVNEDGTIKYTEREIIDCDDTYTEWIPNEYVYVDEKALHMDDAVDCFRREIINIKEFKRIYGNKPGFSNAEYVTTAGDTSNRSYFKLPKDVNEEDVEVLHYYNKSIDAYWVCANNIPLNDDPIPFKHKLLPVSALHHVYVPGRFFGIGIPQVIHSLSEERTTLRRMNIDRNKLILSKPFLHNNAFDIDDEDTVLHPGRMIGIDTNGLPLNQAIQEVNMSETSSSYYKLEEIIQEDIRRATGIDDRIQGVAVGSTATEAAILKESSLKRVNMVSTLAEMDTIRSVGIRKWSNIQFFYPIPRIERITEDNEERENKVYRTVTAQGKQFSVVSDQGKMKLKMDEVRGASSFELKGSLSKYLNKNYDITIDSTVHTPTTKAIQQSKVTEMLSIIAANPALIGTLDPTKTVSRLLSVNDESPKDWMRGEGVNPNDMMMLAESENTVMAAGQPLAGTDGATQEHSMIHLMYMKTADYQSLPPAIQQIIQDHVLQEYDNNPATGSAADLIGNAGLGAAPGAETQINPMGMAADTAGAPQVQTADAQPANFAAGA